MQWNEWAVDICSQIISKHKYVWLSYCFKDFPLLNTTWCIWLMILDIRVKPVVFQIIYDPKRRIMGINNLYAGVMRHKMTHESAQESLLNDTWCTWLMILDIRVKPVVFQIIHDPKRRIMGINNLYAGVMRQTMTHESAY